jgi:hypothetical protein
MSELLQFIIVAAFGALCFGGGYLTAFIVTRNKWRDEKIKRGVARYTGTPANGNGESCRKNPDIEYPARRFPPPWSGLVLSSATTEAEQSFDTCSLPGLGRLAAVIYVHAN